MRSCSRATAVPVLLLLLLGTARAQPSCLHFPELLPAKLRELRVKFEEIKDYFQSKDDDLSIQLLSSDLLEEFKGSLGCQSVSEMMGFYMDEVLPSAMRSSTQHQQSVGDLGNLLLSLRAMMRRCAFTISVLMVQELHEQPALLIRARLERKGRAGGDLSLTWMLELPKSHLHRFFTCEERSRSVKHIKETFSKMHRNGIYKAMGEFDIFINYVEKFLTMRRN